ncbi:MAG TPA: NB-ARC domain-containing protein, partial [Anaerolineales bacterium]|nr:NB-ARC domain-containing protein [Anaerolineales bacterium]
MTFNSLNEKKYTGGLHGARGYEFEKSFILSQLPDWLAHEDLNFFQQELWSDLELFFKSGVRWLVQIKNHTLELAEFREVIRDFETRHRNGNGCYVKFVLVSTGLANSVREIKNLLERWATVVHLDEADLAATRADSADRFGKYGLAEFEEFLFAAAGKIDIQGDLSWIGDENTVQRIFCSKLITDYKLDLQIAKNLYLITSRKLSSERGERIDLDPFRRELITAESDQSIVTTSVPFILPQLDISTFTGRKEELLRLEELILKPEGEKICSIVGLSGSGGIGKSALACHFAELHRVAFPAGVIGLRVDGKSNDAIAREFARLCGEEISIEDERDAATIMQEVFAHRRMLLIFDNAEDTAIHALCPGGTTCAVIITTRDRQLP